MTVKPSGSIQTARYEGRPSSPQSRTAGENAARACIQIVARDRIRDMASGSDNETPSDGDDPGRAQHRRRGLKLPRPPGPTSSEAGGKPRMRKLRFAVVILGLCSLAFVSWMFGIMMAVAQDLPSLENREQYKRAQNSTVYDFRGQRLATLTNNQGRILLPSEEIAPVMKEAVVAVEDTRFYDHRGVDFQGIGRALYQDVLSASAEQGASTITQQFVKNALAAQDSRTILQKFREAAIAYHLERQWSKDKILTEYLNEIYFGEGATGIEAAARTYFGSSLEHEGCGEGDAPSCASELLPWEAAQLAGMISSPAAYSPRANPVDSKARRDLVLQHMSDQGYITDEELVSYQAQPIPAADAIVVPREESEAPYFTSWLRQQLVDRYGAGEAFGGGLQITSTLDLDLQREVEEIVGGTLAGIPPTSSVVVLDNTTGAVRAMVGGLDYEKSPFNLATNGHRQPGSAFKPFTLITALEQGRSSGEVFTSAPQEIPFDVELERNDGETRISSEYFAVDNYNDSYLDSASIATATTYSDNSVYSQLGSQVGPGNIAATANSLGIETDLSTDNEYSIGGNDFAPYNPAMILGGLETGVTPLEMAHAYNSIAADGKRLSGTMAASAGGPVGIIEVLDGEGDPVPDQTGASGENKLVAKQVIDPGVAAEAKSILATVVTSGTGERAQTSEQTWGKTGTTDDNGDAWFCGATEEITTCVWVGYADSVTPMLTEFAGAPVDGGTYPALIFANVVDAYNALAAARKVEEGSDDERESTDVDSGVEAPVAPTTDEAPVAAEAPAESSGESSAPAEQAPAGGDAGSSGAPAAPSGGGITAG